MPDLVARLAGLHATLTARLTLRESLLSLSGRLDMVLQHVDLRATAAPAPLAHNVKKGKATAAAGPAATGTREPRRYVEGESEQEAEAMDVELEEGSDVGSVEDIELGAESGSEADTNAEADMDDEEDDEDEDEDEEYEEGLDGNDDGEDSEEDSEGDEGPWLNGFIDDEAEEAEDESESE